LWRKGLYRSYEKVIEQLKRLKKRVIASKMILFGSYATGKQNKFSDIDVIIIKSTKKRFFDRIGEVLKKYDGDIPLEPLVYTKKEFDEMKLENPLIKMAIREGIEI